MITKKNKTIEVIISYGDDTYLSKKLLSDKNFIDIFFIVDLVNENKKILSKIPPSNLIENPVFVHQFLINSESNFDDLLPELSIKIRDILLNSNLDFEDIILISKSNEFVDFKNFNFNELITSHFLVLQHKKIFWEYNLTDNRHISGTIILKFSNILQKNFFKQVFDHFSSGFDILEHVNNKNGWILFGFDSCQKIIENISFGISKLSLDENNRTEKYLKNLSEKLLPIENYDFIRSEFLKPSLVSEEIEYNFNTNIKEPSPSKTIKINVKKDNLLENNFDIFLKSTNNILDHFLFDEINKTFYVYEPSSILYDNSDKYYLINEIKKILSILDAKDHDNIIIETDWSTIEDKCGLLKNNNISNYIKNPL